VRIPAVVVLSAAIPLAFGAGAKVKIIAVDSSGAMLRECHVRSFAAIAGDRNQFKAQFHDLVADSIPFGQYFAYVDCADKRGAGSIVLVDRPEVFAVLSSPPRGPIAEYTHDGPFTRIVISGLSSETSTRWIKLVGVYLSEVFTAEISTSGEARVLAPQPGEYWLNVFDEGALLYHGRAVITRDQQEITVTVDANRPLHR
jgi:hypothetical protein